MESLPLFAELSPGRSKELVESGVQARRRRASQPVGDRHLAAARRLAKAIRRLPDHSAEQTRAGQAICRHLIALLEESTQDTRTDR